MTTAEQNVTVTHGDLDPAMYWWAKESGSVAWDIETSGLDWATERIGTCQIATAARLNIVVLGGDQHHVPKHLVELLEEQDVRKVFHHAPFDLRFMAHHWDAAPRNIACTKIASKILNPERTHTEHSLQSVLDRYLGVRISKLQQRSDWLADELSDDQLRYAAADVAYLLPLCDRMEEEADRLGVAELIRASWAYLPARVELDLRGAGDVFAY